MELRQTRNRGWTGFSSGGTEGLWSSHSQPEDNRLVLCKSAIDAMSHAVLFPAAQTRYASIAGQMNPAEPDLIRFAAVAMPRNSRIVAAMDSDAQRAKLADAVRTAVLLTGREDLIFVFETPDGWKDWNDQMRRKPKAPGVNRDREPSVA